MREGSTPEEPSAGEFVAEENGAESGTGTASLCDHEAADHGKGTGDDKGAAGNHGTDGRRPYGMAVSAGGIISLYIIRKLRKTGT